MDLARLAATPWSILSRHHHACNLLAGDGALIALVSEVHGNGPFHVVIPNARFDGLPDQAQVNWRTTQLQLGDLTVALETATPWNPQLPPLTNRSALTLLYPHLTQLRLQSPLYSSGPVLVERAQQGIAWLQLGLTHRNRHFIAEGTEQLAGLGPGLTPAGDDFLVGLLAALTALLAQSENHHDLCQTITAVASSHTTRLSKAWLDHAGRGCFGEPWHRLINALNDGTSSEICQAVDAIAATGATSGIDALYGFVVGIQIKQLP